MQLRVGVPQADGSVVYEQDTTKWGSVSRHGLLQAGIICPYCEHEAARKGEFAAIQETRFGQAIACRACNAVLLASPDDDVDPVKPGDQYNVDIYHTFAVTKQTRRIGQRLSSEMPRLGDWVVITTDRPVALEGTTSPEVNYFGNEGRVDKIHEGIFTVALNGNHGIGGAGSAPGSGIGGAWAAFARDEIRVMIVPVLRVGDEVMVMHGPHHKKIGAVASITQGRVAMDMKDGQRLSLPIERIEKIVADEQTI